MKRRTADSVYDGSDGNSVGGISNNQRTVSNFFKTTISTTIQIAGGEKAEQGGN